MKKWIIVTDLDGTLLHNDKSVSGYTKYIFDYLHSKGFIIAINTSRRLEITRQYASMISADCWSCYNGAMIVCNGKMLIKHKITARLIPIIFAVIQNYLNIIRWSVAYEDRTYSNYEDPYYHVINDITKLPFLEPIQILIKELPEKYIDCLAGEIREKCKENVYCQVLERKTIVVTDKNARKDIALSSIMEFYGLTEQDVIAFGDDINDLRFLDKATYGVVTGNADEVIKRNFEYVCDTNENDGVAKWLEQHFIEKL